MSDLDTPPEHIMPRALPELSTDELEALLTRVRAARLRGAQMHAEAVAIAKMARDDTAREQLTKQCDMLAASMERVDKAVEAMDARIQKVRALRLELGLD